MYKYIKIVLYLRKKIKVMKRINAKILDTIKLDRESSYGILDKVHKLSLTGIKNLNKVVSKMSILSDQIRIGNGIHVKIHSIYKK